MFRVLWRPSTTRRREQIYLRQNTADQLGLSPHIKKAARKKNTIKKQGLTTGRRIKIMARPTTMRMEKGTMLDRPIMIKKRSRRMMVTVKKKTTARRMPASTELLTL